MAQSTKPSPMEAPPTGYCRGVRVRGPYRRGGENSWRAIDTSLLGCDARRQLLSPDESRSLARPTQMSSRVADEPGYFKETALLRDKYIEGLGSKFLLPHLKRAPVGSLEATCAMPNPLCLDSAISHVPCGGRPSITWKSCASDNRLICGASHFSGRVI